jgi:hypothetical protein
MILETPGMEEGYDAVNVDRARALFRGEPLPELPPEAFELRPRRARAALPPATRPETGPAPGPARPARRRSVVGSPGA